MTIARIMTTEPVTIPVGFFVVDAAAAMLSQETGSVIVMGDDGDVVGIVTERDIVRATASREPLGNLTVASVVDREPIVCSPDTPIETAARTLLERWSRYLLVMDEGQLVGVASLRDLAALLAQDVDGASLLAGIASSDLARVRRLTVVGPGDLD